MDIARYPRTAVFGTCAIYRDIATVHTAHDVLDWLQAKFGGRTISNRTVLEWSPKSQQFDPFDLWFWGHVISEVVRKNPQPSEDTMDTAQNVIEVLEKCDVAKIFPIRSQEEVPVLQSKRRPL